MIGPYEKFTNWWDGKMGFRWFHMIPYDSIWFHMIPYDSNIFDIVFPPGDKPPGQATAPFSKHSVWAGVISYFWRTEIMIYNIGCLAFPILYLHSLQHWTVLDQVRSREDQLSRLSDSDHSVLWNIFKHLGARNSLWFHHVSSWQSLFSSYPVVILWFPLCFPPLQPSHNGFNRSTSSALNARSGDAAGFHTPAEDLGRLSLRQQLRHREMWDMNRYDSLIQ